MESKPIVLAFMGKSASGKDTCAHSLFNFMTQKGFNVRQLVSMTSRPQRLQEQGGKDYIFVNKKTFENMLEKDYFIEATKYKD